MTAGAAETRGEPVRAPAAAAAGTERDTGVGGAAAEEEKEAADLRLSTLLGAVSARAGGRIGAGEFSDPPLEVRSAAVRGEEMAVSLRTDASGLPLDGDEADAAAVAAAIVAAAAESSEEALDELRLREACMGEWNEFIPSEGGGELTLRFMDTTDLRREADTMTTSAMDCGASEEEASDMDGEIGRPGAAVDESCCCSGVEVCATSPFVY